MRTRSRPAALLLAAAPISIPLGGCVTIAPRSRPPGERAKIVPGVPLVRFGPERCGAGALASVLNALGDPVTIEQLDATLPKAAGGGVLSVDLPLAARERGFQARLDTGSEAAVLEVVERVRPSILMPRVLEAPGERADPFHYVVADGVDPGRGLVRLHFGDGKARWAPFTRIERHWAAAGHALLLVERGTGGARAAAEEGQEEE